MIALGWAVAALLWLVLGLWILAEISGTVMACRSGMDAPSLSMDTNMMSRMRDTGISRAAYRCSADGYERIDVQLPQEVDL